ncbi:MAG TPA: hypothetical protein DEA91_28765 [Paenibacillus sp.]|nr:hypothetical protein [Paenibacillus sp.]
MSSEAETQKLLNQCEYNQQRNLLAQTIKMMLYELACFSSSVCSRLRGFPDAWLLVSCKPKIPFS